MEEASARTRRCDGGLYETVPAGSRWRDGRARWSERWTYLLRGERDEPIPAARGPVEPPVKPPDQPIVGICCSGGGIRSAAFNLGALQALQDAGKLQSADYLAAVSGGSYIAAAFSMVATTDAAPTLDGTANQPGANSDTDLIEKQPPFARGSPEEQYLRNRSSYLAPDGMAKLFLAYRIVLGLLFNVIFVSLPLFGATMLFGVFVYRPAFPQLAEKCSQTCKGLGPVPLWCWAVPAGIAALSALLGGVAMVMRFKQDTRLRVFQVWSTRLLILASALALVTLLLPELVSLMRVTGTTKGAGTATGAPPATGLRPVVPIAGAAGGLAALLAGVAAQMSNVIKSAKEVDEKLKGVPRRLRTAIAYLAAALVGPTLLYGVMVFSLSLALANTDTGSERWRVIGAGMGAIVTFALLWCTIDLTSLSLHTFYRRRLCTAFALQRVRLPYGKRTATTLEEEGQGIAVERPYRDLVKLSDTALDADEKWPTLLVCAAANVSDPGATPPGRHVTSFTFSAHTIGGPLIGATKTETYEDVLEEDSKRRRDLTLPAAVAMSGAAVAPSMGKKTKWPLRFLMALANVRLGVWVPNPRWIERAKEGPNPWLGFLRSRPVPWYLLCELTGRNRVDAKYLFVTDGGHYENLGLVELLRRGCTQIYCFDASGGKTFEELGDAVALARSELGVEIDIKPEDLEPKTSKEAEEGDGEKEVAARDVVTASFKYRDEGGQTGAEGVLVYARNVMTVQAPWDVKAHHRANPAFPHDSTFDQLYTDQKFESYRALGEMAGQNAIALMAAANAPNGGSCLGQLCEAVLQSFVSTKCRSRPLSRG